MDSKNSQTTPRTTNTTSIRQLLAPLTRKRHILPHPAQAAAPRTRKRHQQEHQPQRPTERSDPTQHAKGRTGDCPGPRIETTTRRNVTQGGGGGLRPPPKIASAFSAPVGFPLPPDHGCDRVPKRGMRGLRHGARMVRTLGWCQGRIQNSSGLQMAPGNSILRGFQGTSLAQVCVHDPMPAPCGTPGRRYRESHGSCDLCSTNGNALVDRTQSLQLGPPRRIAFVKRPPSRRPL